jgi:hypothetical protein
MHSQAVDVTITRMVLEPATRLLLGAAVLSSDASECVSVHSLDADAGLLAARFKFAPPPDRAKATTRRMQQVRARACEGACGAHACTRARMCACACPAPPVRSRAQASSCCGQPSLRAVATALVCARACVAPQVASLHGLRPGLRDSVAVAFTDRVLTFEARPDTRANSTLHDPRCARRVRGVGCCGRVRHTRAPPAPRTTHTSHGFHPRTRGIHAPQRTTPPAPPPTPAPPRLNSYHFIAHAGSTITALSRPPALLQGSTLLLSGAADGTVHM